jgi:hypothetical protein
MENSRMTIKGEDRGLNYQPMLNFCRVLGARTGQIFDVSVLLLEKKSACQIVSSLLILIIMGYS